MTNLCPRCLSPIPKNAKACILHRAQAVLENKDTGILLRAHTKRGTKAQEQRALQASKAKRSLHLQALRIRPCTKSS